MKNLTKILLLSVLAMSIVTGAFAADYTVSGLFSVSYDDAYTLDDTTYLSENTDSNRWLFMLYDEDATIDSYMEQIEGYEELSLVSATQEDRDAYVEDTLEAYADYDIAFVKAIEVGEYKIPFYLYTITDEDGPYLMAETIQAGYSINFLAYYEEEGVAVDDALTAKLEAVVQTFAPVIE